MFLSRLLAPCLFASAVAAFPVAAQTVEFQGGGFLTDFTEACGSEGWTGTVQVVARMRPAEGQGAGATETTLNLFVNTYAMHFRFPQQPFGAGDLATATAFTAIGGGFVSNPAAMPRLRALQAPDGTVQSGTDEAHLVFEVQDFSNTAGCTFRGNLWLHRR